MTGAIGSFLNLSKWADGRHLRFNVLTHCSAPTMD